MPDNTIRIMMLSFLRYILVFLFLSLLCACRSGNAPLPNIIIIFTDDQGYADAGIYGAEGFTTPHIDRMAGEGIRFTDFYSAASVCSPSRAALLTGCYPLRVGIPEVLAPQGPSWTEGRTDIGLNSNEVTIAEILKKQGYNTACIGKWHLGHHNAFLPTRHGFDEYFGLPYSNDMIPPDYPPLPLMEGEQVIELNPDQSQLTRRYTQRAVQFIEKNREQPFFIYLAHSMPHVPLYVSENFRDKTADGLYGDVITELDWSVGEIMDTVTKLGLDERTLLIYTSDNGPWLTYGNHAGSARPLRDGKNTSFEGGHRVPCIMRWPGQIKAGQVCREVVSTIDFLPTIASISGAGLPQVKLDGRNILELMRGTAAQSPHQAFYYYNGSELQAIRSGNWKLHLPHTYRATIEMQNDGLPGRREEKKIDLSLFNLQEDIGERHNVAAENQDIVQRLSEMAQTFAADITANARPPGKVH